MNKEVRKLMEKHNVPQSIMTLYGLEIERIAEEYAQQQVKLFAIPDVGGSFNISESAKEKLDYILGNAITREFPKVQPTKQWVGAVLDFLEIVGILK